MSNRDDFKSVFDSTKDDSIVAATQPIAALPFSSQRRNVPSARLSKSSQGFENAQSRLTVNRPQLAFGFGCEGESQCRDLVEQLLDHFSKIATHNGVSGVSLGEAATNGIRKLGANRFF